ncbi:MAG: hypothetical protein GF398_04505 [Chitinivibrionales bacterium]|nr:hypothetical protein [Chitinivibrionales bacterium]
MRNVTKRDLVEKISEKTGLTQVDTKIVVESFLEAVSSALQTGKNIEIRGFGRFKIKRKNARQARNPRTGEQIQVGAGFKPIFEASNDLRDRVNIAYLKQKEENNQQPAPTAMPLQP